MSDEPGWRKLLPAFSLRTLLEVVFVCGVVFYLWLNRPPSNVIQTGHVLHIDADGAYPESPIKGHYLVDPDGNVNLGAVYGPAGKVRVVAMTADDAQRTIVTELAKVLRNPQVTVSIAGWQDDRETSLTTRIGRLENEVEGLKQQIANANK
jgi:protein involved in polysaccharide export with SLBB domain